MAQGGRWRNKGRRQKAEGERQIAVDRLSAFRLDSAFRLPPSAFRLSPLFCLPPSAFILPSAFRLPPLFCLPPSAFRLYSAFRLPPSAFILPSAFRLPPLFCLPPSAFRLYFAFRLPPSAFIPPSAFRLPPLFCLPPSAFRLYSAFRLPPSAFILPSAFRLPPSAFILPLFRLYSSCMRSSAAWRRLLGDGGGQVAARAFDGAAQHIGDAPQPGGHGGGVVKGDQLEINLIHRLSSSSVSAPRRRLRECDRGSSAAFRRWHRRSHADRPDNRCPGHRDRAAVRR